MPDEPEPDDAPLAADQKLGDPQLDDASMAAAHENAIRRADLPPLDIGALTALFDGDAEFVRHLLGEFVTLQPRLPIAGWPMRWPGRSGTRCGRRRTSWPDPRAPSAPRDLAAAAAEVELAVIDRRLDGIAALVARVGAELDHVVAHIEAG